MTERIGYDVTVGLTMVWFVYIAVRVWVSGKREDGPDG